MLQIGASSYWAELFRKEKDMEGHSRKTRTTSALTDADSECCPDAEASARSSDLCSETVTIHFIKPTRLLRMLPPGLLWLAFSYDCLIAMQTCESSQQETEAVILSPTALQNLLRSFPYTPAWAPPPRPQVNWSGARASVGPRG